MNGLQHTTGGDSFRIGCLVAIREPMIRETFAALARHGLQKNWSFLWWPDRHVAKTALARNPVDVLISNGDHDLTAFRQSKWTIRLGVLGPVADYNLTADHKALATLCYRHICFRGTHSIGLWGFDAPLRHGATLRRLQIEHLCRQDRIPYAYAPTNNPEDFKGTLKRLSDWLTTQSTPLGMIVNRVEHAHMMLHACQLARLTVPKQVRLIALTDDEPLSELSSPTISTGIIHHRGQGRILAGLLDALAANRPPDWRHQVIPPLGVMPRGSTDALLCGDPDLDHAISQLSPHNISAETIGNILGLSQRQVQRRFKHQHGVTLKSVLTNLKMEQAVYYLVHSRLPISAITDKLGYQSAESFSHCFKRFYGKSPQKWLQDTTD